MKYFLLLAVSVLAGCVGKNNIEARSKSGEGIVYTDKSWNINKFQKPGSDTTINLDGGTVVRRPAGAPILMEGPPPTQMGYGAAPGNGDPFINVMDPNGYPVVVRNPNYFGPGSNGGNAYSFSGGGAPASFGGGAGFSGGGGNYSYRH
jgi:hypothetical protein